jgi:predicted branched-subunit amino acid permease
VQLSATQLFQSPHPLPELLLTAPLLILHQVIFGLALGQALPLTPWQRLLAAALLNDGPYAVSTSVARPSFARLLGAEVSMYGFWNGATLLGLLVGAQLPQLLALELDMLVPLLFLTLLIPQLRSALAFGVAGSAGLLAAMLATVAPGNLALPLAVGLTLGGGWLVRRAGLPRRRAE